MSFKTNVVGKPPANGAEMFVYRPAVGSDQPNDGRGASELTPALRAEFAKREQEVWQKGFSEGQAKARTDADKQVAEIRDSVAAALKDFVRARQDYFAHLETEVVQLALSIARKILNREAFVDPMLLAGLVHVALDKMGQESHTRLRAHPSQIAAWREHFQRNLGNRIPPELIGDDSLAPTQCVLETELGSTEISLEGHLKEIEQGFFDLLAQRPRSS